MSFLKAGHLPTLIAAFLYFDVSFMVWVILGPLGPWVSDSMHLSASQKGFLIATPLLAGSFFRPLLGMLADAIGGRRAGLAGLSLTCVALLAGWNSQSFPQLLTTGFLLGIAGASFAVALPLASRWYPPEYQGLAMGIAGAGNSGTLIATLFAPRIAAVWGWQNAIGLALIPVLVVAVLFAVLAKDCPGARTRISWEDYGRTLGDADTLWFCLLYSITFGGFVGLASFLTVFFHDQYGLAKVAAGDFTTLVVLCGSFLRPVGGWLADRFGGYRVLLVVLMIASSTMLYLATLPSLSAALGVLAIAMGMFGVGNGAVFQLVPQRFASQVGIVTGVVGAAGGLGGFLLPSLFGVLKDSTGTYATGVAAFGAFVLLGFGVLLMLGSRWQRVWPPALQARAGVWTLRSVQGQVYSSR